jgi:CRP/FNR family cyclic AMP-dependent transcriptional regulator
VAKRHSTPSPSASENNLHASLLKSKLFAGLPDTSIRKILHVVRVRRIAPQANVIVAGGWPENLFLLRRGRARCYALAETGHEVVLAWMNPGFILGLVTLLRNPARYMVNATTISECEFMVWTHKDIHRLAAEYPLLLENSLRLALEYLNKYMTRHLEVVTKSAESRLARTLGQLASSSGEVHSSGIAIEITNEQLSSLSDVSLYTASRILAKWQRQRKLVKQRGRVTLLAPETLMTS